MQIRFNARCRNAADRKAVPLMNVGHREAGANDAGKRGYIHSLNERLVLLNLVDEGAA